VSELLGILDELRVAGGGDCALATIIETKGSTYRRAGARLVVRSDRRMWGAISGGCLEADIVEHALQVIARGEPKLVRYRAADDDLVIGFGSGCNGEIAVLIEPLPIALHAQLAEASSTSSLITTLHGTFIGSRDDAPHDAFVQQIVPRLTLLLFGASPAAESLLRFAKQLGWCVRIADHRPFVASDERYALADSIEIAPTHEQPARFAYYTNTAVVVMTHHYLRDVALLRALAHQPLAYLGMIGSRDRARRVLAEINSDALASTLHAPAGLDLGADAPSEIALSIIAEIQSMLRNTNAMSLRARHDAIVILAAGASRRLGRPKQLVEIDGKSLLRRAAETALASGASSVHVILGAEIVRARTALQGLPVDVIVNQSWREGIASSIRCAVDALDHRVDTLTLILCDQPGITADALRRLRDTHHTTHASVVASRYPEGPGVPALFTADLFTSLRTLRGDIGARDFIRTLDREIVTVPFEHSEDVDTVEDVMRIAFREHG